ncbi:MAG: ABC transporter permease [Clostridiales bacterium]|jgi:putative ABC transport system permease protein|nr:MAG: ABC transporter permease [Clostridiales bacterium]
MSYLASLNPMNLFGSLPGNIAQGLIWGLMALGVYITFRLLDFADLTVDGTFATGGAVTVVLILHGWSAPAALLVAVLAGLAAGLITGLLHTLLGIPPILAGILTQIALYSINLNIMGMANLAVSVDNYPLILSLRKVTQSILISLIFAAVIIAILYWYFGTEQGSSIRATGCNPAMSKAQGININFTKVLALAISNGLVGLSGGLMAQYQGFSDINMGRGAIVIGLAAVIIGEVLGEAIFRKHLNFFGRLTFVVLGGVIYYIVVGVVLWLKLPSNDLKLFTAVIVAIFLAVPYLKAKSKTSFAKAAKKGAQHNA